MNTGFQAIPPLAFGILRAALLRRIRCFTANYFCCELCVHLELSPCPPSRCLPVALIHAADFHRCLLQNLIRHFKVSHTLSAAEHAVQLPQPVGLGR